MRVAVVGLGSIGRRHVGNLLALGHDVFGSDPSKDALAAAVQQFPEMGLFCPDLDAVVIATPWNTHLDYVEACIEANAPFYVEKPLGSLEQLPRWRELAAMELPVNQVGYQLRFHPRYLAMRQLVPKPIGGAFHCCFDISTWPGKSYGPPELEVSHELDLAFDCGLTASAVTTDRFKDNYYRSWEINDDCARAEVEFFSSAQLGDQMYVDAMAHFLDCVREKKPTTCPLSHGVRVLEALCRS